MNYYEIKFITKKGGEKNGSFIWKLITQKRQRRK